MIYFREIWFPNREHSTLFKAMFVLCLYATHSFIFVNNAKLVHRRQPYPMCVGTYERMYVCRYIRLNVCMHVLMQ
jgi:hypothetical protein